MARIIPKSPFLRTVEHEQWKRDPLIDKWLSPEGVAQGVNLVDMVGGTIHSAIEGATEEDNGLTYEQALGEVAAADSVALRRQAIAKVMGSSGRPRTARWTDRMAGKAQSQIVVDAERLLPPIAKKTGSGGGRRRANQNVGTMWRKTSDEVMNSAAAKQIRLAQHLKNQTPGIFIKGGTPDDPAGQDILQVVATREELLLEQKLRGEGRTDAVYAMHLSRIEQATAAQTLLNNKKFDLEAASRGLSNYSSDVDSATQNASFQHRLDPEWQARMRHLGGVSALGHGSDAVQFGNTISKYNRFRLNNPSAPVEPVVILPDPAVIPPDPAVKLPVVPLGTPPAEGETANMTPDPGNMTPDLTPAQRKDAKAVSDLESALVGATIVRPKGKGIRSDNYNANEPFGGDPDSTPGMTSSEIFTKPKPVRVPESRRKQVPKVKLTAREGAAAINKFSKQPQAVRNKWLSIRPKKASEYRWVLAWTEHNGQVGPAKRSFE